MSRRRAFIAAALSSNTDDCIIWPFAVRASSGYGAYDTCVGGVKTNYDIHRFICLKVHGQAEENEEAAHDCGRKLCINPKHLYWKSPLENMQDAIRHKTLIGGGRYRQKLFDKEISHIVSAAESLVTLGKIYGMEPAYIGQVRRKFRDK